MSKVSSDMRVGDLNTGTWCWNDGFWWRNAEPMKGWRRLCWRSEMYPHPLSIHRDCRGKLWIISDPNGCAIFRRESALAGPFNTLEGAQAAYTIMAMAGTE